LTDIAKKTELCYNVGKGKNLAVGGTMAELGDVRMFTFSGAIEGTGLPTPYG
jgi:hypothetical protein